MTIFSLLFLIIITMYIIMIIIDIIGFRPLRRSVIGEPMIPNEDKQLQIRRSPYNNDSNTDDARSTQSPSLGSPGNVNITLNFRTFAKHMDTLERYNTATQQLMERGQTQQMLLRIVQAKMSERVNSYAAQLIRTRKLFEAFDINGDGVLDEGEFRICLEKLNIQFDDVQSLALFAYFDYNNDGFVEWEEFAENSMVQNPRGGTAVLPKMITAVATDHVSMKNQKFK
jgi:Ca2+-binding EF-hand superfamily protein